MSQDRRPFHVASAIRSGSGLPRRLRCCILSGAAARTCQVGDEIIIAASTYVQPHNLYTLEPRILTFGLDNSIDQRLSYPVFESEARKLTSAF